MSEAIRTEPRTNRGQHHRHAAQTARLPAFPAVSAALKGWRPETTSISRAEMRRIVANMIG